MRTILQPLLLLSLLLVSTSVLAASYSDDFSTDRIGTDWNTKAGSFAVAAGVLSSSPASNENVIQYDDPMGSDEYTVSIDVSTGPLWGIVIAGDSGFTSGNAYIVTTKFPFGPTDNAITINEMGNNHDIGTELADANTATGNYSTGTLTVSIVGGEIQADLSLGGGAETHSLDYTPGSLPGRYVGFYTDYNATSTFDNFSAADDGGGGSVVPIIMQLQ